MTATSTIEEPRFARFLFTSPVAAGIWLVARIWLGYQWLHAGWEKITGTESGWHWAFTSQSSQQPISEVWKVRLRGRGTLAGALADMTLRNNFFHYSTITLAAKIFSGAIL